MESSSTSDEGKVKVNKFETRQVETVKVMMANGLEDYAANTLAYLTRITKKESTRKEVVALIEQFNLGKYLEVRNGVYVPKH